MNENLQKKLQRIILSEGDHQKFLQNLFSEITEIREEIFNKRDDVEALESIYKSLEDLWEAIRDYCDWGLIAKEQEVELSSMHYDVEQMAWHAIRFFRISGRLAKKLQN